MILDVSIIGQWCASLSSDVLCNIEAYPSSVNLVCIAWFMYCIHFQPHHNYNCIQNQDHFQNTQITKHGLTDLYRLNIYSIHSSKLTSHQKYLIHPHPALTLCCTLAASWFFGSCLIFGLDSSSHSDSSSTHFQLPLLIGSTLNTAIRLLLDKLHRINSWYCLDLLHHDCRRYTAGHA